MAGESRPGEPVRQGEGAEGFPHGSKYPLFVGLGLFLVGLALAWAPVILVLAIPVEVYGLWGWTREYAIEEYEAGVIPEQKRQIVGTETGLLGMYILVFSEILVFAGFFVAWFFLDATRGPFPPEGLPDLTVALGVVMTALLLLGSLTTYYGRRGVTNGNRSSLVRGYTATVLLGIGYLAVLAYEWQTLMAEGLTWTNGPYGASYYALTGLHAGHLMAGLVLFAIVLYRTVRRGHFSASRNLMVRTAEVYWHFLTALSIAILVFVYVG
jgi:cytochrome c oxidase subunit 3